MTRNFPNNNALVQTIVLEAFKSTGYLTINKELIKSVGLIQAIVLSNYIDKSIYFSKKYPDNEGWFYFPHNQQMEELNIKEATARRCKKDLIYLGILEVKMEGNPAKEWIKINVQGILQLLHPRFPQPSKMQTPRPSECRPLDPQNADPYIYRNNKPKNIYSAEDSRNGNSAKGISPLLSSEIPQSKLSIKTKNIIPPPLKAVEDYCKERKNTIDPQEFVDFYESKGWLIGKNKMKDWQAAIRVWEKGEQKRLTNNTAVTKHMKPFIYDDGIKYVLRPNGEYYHCVTGERYIP